MLNKLQPYLLSHTAILPGPHEELLLIRVATAQAIRDRSEDIIQNVLRRDKKMENIEEKLRYVVDGIRGLIRLIGIT